MGATQAGARVLVCPGTEPAPPTGAAIPCPRGPTPVLAGAAGAGLPLDATVCPQCGGHMRLIAALTDPASVRRCLQGVESPSELLLFALCRLPGRQ